MSKCSPVDGPGSSIAELPVFDGGDYPFRPGRKRQLASLLQPPGFPGSLSAASRRMEDRVDTDIDDVWSALTDPSRLARWYGKIEGDLHLGGEYRARLFASGWEGTGRVDACEPPRRLLVTIKDADDQGEGAIEVALDADGDQTIVVWRNGACRWTTSPPTGRGSRPTSRISPPTSPDVGASTARPRFGELLPAYQDLAANIG